MKTTKEYVLAFPITPSSRVVLIEKQRPGWQKGKLNGLGGEVEAFETHRQAVRREVREECGVDHEEWDYVGRMSGADWVVHVYTATSEAFYVAKTMTDEVVALHPTGAIKLGYNNMVENLPALLSLVMLPPAEPSNTRPFFELSY